MSEETIHVAQKNSVHCKHFRGMHEKDTCEAGVAFQDVRLLGTWKYRNRENDKTVYTVGVCYPCSKKYNFGGATCDKAEFPTPEEIEAETRENTLRFANTMKARAAIVEHCGGPWKKGTPGTSGAIDCPVCGGSKTLRFSRAGYNGHIHAACTKEGGCVSWME